MNGRTFLLILSGVLLNAAAQLALKASVKDLGALSLNHLFYRLAAVPWLWLGLLCYGLSVIIWLLALSRVDVSLAYPMLSIGYIVNALAAAYWLNEPLNGPKIIGIAIIIFGVIILSRS